MKDLLKIWEFLSGKKRIIGGIMLIIASTPHLMEFAGVQVIDVLKYYGNILAAGGVAVELVGISHAAKKAGDKK